MSLPPWRPTAALAATLVVALFLAVVPAVLTGGPSVYAQPVLAEPDNPTDSELDGAEQTRQQRAAAVGRLAAAIAMKNGQMTRLSLAAELAVEKYNKAYDDLVDATATARRARAAVEVADEAVQGARGRVASFARGSYVQGAMLGSAVALLDDGGPTDLVRRLDYMVFTSRHRLDVVGQVERAKVVKANADSAARAAVIAERAATAQAARAKQVAGQQVAQSRSQLAGLRRQSAQMRQQLTRAQVALSGLRAQRQQYVAWQQRQAQLAAQHAAQVAALQQAAAGREHGSIDFGGSWSAAKGQAVADAALNWLGTPYAWGGGTQDGPSWGTYPDEGVRGFDCSGLALWAWGQVGVDLPHYSGYQYNRGRHVSTDELMPGDLVFWSYDGTPDGIHHVAIWLGGGQVVQAPQSGDVVRVSPMWYSGYLGATRPGT